MIVDYFFNVISRGSGFLVKWLLNIIFSALLVTSEFGVYTYYMSIAYIITSVLLFGFEIFILNESRSVKTSSDVNRCFIQTLIAVSLMSFILIPLSTTLFYLVISISISQIFIVYSKTENEFTFEAKGSLISICIIVVSALVYIFFDYNVLVDVENALLFASFLIFLCSIPSVFLFVNNNSGNKNVVFSPNVIIKQYVERRFYGVHELASVANQHVFVLMCALILNFNDLGIYKLGQLYLTPLMLVPASMSQVFLKRLKSDSSDKKTIFLIVTLALILFSFSLFMLPFVDIYLWDESNDTVFYVYILYALTLSVQVINVYFGSKLTIINCQKERASNSMKSFVFTIFTVVILSMNFGVVGISISLLMNYLFLMGLNCYSYEKYKHLHVRA